MPELREEDWLKFPLREQEVREVVLNLWGWEDKLHAPISFEHSYLLEIQDEEELVKFLSGIRFGARCYTLCTCVLTVVGLRGLRILRAAKYTKKDIQLALRFVYVGMTVKQARSITKNI